MSNQKKLRHRALALLKDAAGAHFNELSIQFLAADAVTDPGEKQMLVETLVRSLRAKSPATDWDSIAFE